MLVVGVVDGTEVFQLIKKMNKTYILKKKPIPADLKAADELKRKQVEEIMGRKLQNFEWDTYKILIRDRPKN